MTNLEWLLNGDLVISHLVKEYLLNEPTKSNNQGFIEQYLSKIDLKTLKWGDGFYGPKWTSTHYTLLDLKYMEIMPNTKLYKDSLIHYVTHFWNKYIIRHGIETMDLCISGMMIQLLTYAKIEDERIYDMIDYILSKKMSDGGWNCLWNHVSKPSISSVHTTINVLEGLSEYIKNHYVYRLEEVKQSLNEGIDCLLERELYYTKNGKEVIHKSMTQHHFPPRWKYDYLRVLEFLAKYQFPYTAKIKKALDLLESHLHRGKLSKGSIISGRIHFPLEDQYFGRFNTLRAYIVLKFYRPLAYEHYSKLIA
jgi:hypothetical protein